MKIFVLFSIFVCLPQATVDFMHHIVFPFHRPRTKSIQQNFFSEHLIPFDLASLTSRCPLPINVLKILIFRPEGGYNDPTSSIT
jgi:hypothetical protein